MPARGERHWGDDVKSYLSNKGWHKSQAQRMLRARHKAPRWWLQEPRRSWEPHKLQEPRKSWVAPCTLAAPQWWLGELHMSFEE